MTIRSVLSGSTRIAALFEIGGSYKERKNTVKADVASLGSDSVFDGSTVKDTL